MGILEERRTGRKNKPVLTGGEDKESQKRVLGKAATSHEEAGEPQRGGHWTWLSAPATSTAAPKGRYPDWGHCVWPSCLWVLCGGGLNVPAGPDAPSCTRGNFALSLPTLVKCAHAVPYSSREEDADFKSQGKGRKDARLANLMRRVSSLS